MDQNHTKLPGECGQVIQTQTTKLFNSKITALARRPEKGKHTLLTIETK